jgi:hypothetical protein
MSAPRTYREFWPYYVGEHGRSGTRWLHFVGTAGVIVMFVIAIVTLNGWWLVAMPLFGYAFAWIGHFAVEHNKPATFRFPVWSLIGDFHMFALMCLGRMSDEVARCAELTAGRRL